jgi:hypothetical protein
MTAPYQVGDVVYFNGIYWEVGGYDGRSGDLKVRDLRDAYDLQGFSIVKTRTGFTSAFFAVAAEPTHMTFIGRRSTKAHFKWATKGTCPWCGQVRYMKNMWNHTNSDACKSNQAHHELRLKDWRPVSKANKKMLAALEIPFVARRTQGLEDTNMYGVGSRGDRTKLWCPRWAADILADSRDNYQWTFLGKRLFKFHTRAEARELLMRTHARQSR